MNYSGTNLTKFVQYLYKENYKNTTEFKDNAKGKKTDITWFKKSYFLWDNCQLIGLTQIQCDPKQIFSKLLAETDKFIKNLYRKGPTITKMS